jgi:hypothetical protein
MDVRDTGDFRQDTADRQGFYWFKQGCFADFGKDAGDLT